MQAHGCKVKCSGCLRMWDLTGLHCSSSVQQLLKAYKADQPDAHLHGCPPACSATSAYSSCSPLMLTDVQESRARRVEHVTFACNGGIAYRS